MRVSSLLGRNVSCCDFKQLFPRLACVALHGGTGETKEEVCSTSIRLPGSDEIPVHTITADNGKEFADHSRVAKVLEAQFFFAKPYHYWQRGLNEHTNGLVREDFPKGTDFRKVSDEEVQKVQDRLNARPRKVLGYRTPTEVMFGLEVKPYIPVA